MPQPKKKQDESNNNGSDKPAISGYQEGIHYPKMPSTPDEFAGLLENPEKPAELQAAPSPEKLNPHLFPERLP